MLEQRNKSYREKSEELLFNQSTNKKHTKLVSTSKSDKSYSVQSSLPQKLKITVQTFRQDEALATH